MHSAEVRTKRKTVRVSLIGNPNSGKSSLFNHFTNLNQKTGNFPGVTVDRKEGLWKINSEYDILLTDLPGSYNLFPLAADEKLVAEVILDDKHPNHPDLVIYVADVTRLEKHFLLLSQLIDLQIPCILALNMSDLAGDQNQSGQVDGLSKKLGIPTVAISAREGDHLDTLKEMVIGHLHALPEIGKASYYKTSRHFEDHFRRIADMAGTSNLYKAKLIAHHCNWLPGLTKVQREKIEALNKEAGFEDLPAQVDEIMQRFDFFMPLIRETSTLLAAVPERKTEVADRIFTHRIFGPLIFFAIMILVFQAIFSWAIVPMDWIEMQFTKLSTLVRGNLGDGWFTDLISRGILPGLSGILVFVPQIAILFLLINFLEQLGYMARVVYLFDHLLSRFGLNGRSVVALISGGACAIPAIMSTRTIQNWKERLITILITPFISCSARIPVYTVLIGFVVPSVTVLGIFNAQGLVFMGLYILGITAALIAAIIFKFTITSREPSFLIIELPPYRMPQWKNVLLSAKEKVFAFVMEAGKIILVISIILWVLADHGPAQRMIQAESEAELIAEQRGLSEDETAHLRESKKLEASFAASIGKVIEPVIEPLGYDWKIGIALLTSFAAREVFVGTMATIYSIGSDSDEIALRARMAKERDIVTGRPVYNMATSLSLLIFYVFAMQCMSTLAVVRRETGSWKWPMFQLLFMTGLAYSSSFLIFQLLT